jgi:hypothetical protein
MAFLRVTHGDREAEIRGARVFLRQPGMHDYAAWAELRALSRQHLMPWEPKCVGTNGRQLLRLGKSKAAGTQTSKDSLASITSHEESNKVGKV